MNKNKGLTTSAAIIIVGLALSGSVFFGLKSMGNQQQEVLPAKNQPEVKPTVSKQARVVTSIDDDPVLGNKEKARVAIVEFSDYECPFCARFKEETLPQIKENYLDTGQAILVYRDLPLPFHDPAATRQANAAECVQEQAGDQAYFDYHNLIFENTEGNGEGLSEQELVDLASNLSVNTSELKTCIENNQFADEIKQDANTAEEMGITGTPGFVIGSLDDQGNVTGIKVKGARPYADFQQAIEQFINE